MSDQTLDAIKRLLRKAVKAETTLRKSRRKKGWSSLAEAAELYDLGRTLQAATKLANHLEIEARLASGQGDEIERYI